MLRASIVGGTGLVGSNILSTLLSSPSVALVTAYTRHSPTITDTKLDTVISPEPSTWITHLTALSQSEVPQIFFSALGTTKAKAGDFQAQRRIDLDLNLQLAKSAKDAGVKVYVLISGGLGGGSNSRIPFVKLKIEIEDAVKKLEFDHTVIVQPGLIVGTRSESRPVEAIVRGTAQILGAISGGYLKDGWAQDADVIGRAAVRAGLKAAQDETTAQKVWVVEQKEILSLGREA